MSKEQWNNTATGLLKKELRIAGVTHEELAARLSTMGIAESKASIAMKMSRGSFSASFFLAALSALGRTQIEVNL